MRDSVPSWGATTDSVRRNNDVKAVGGAVESAGGGSSAGSAEAGGTGVAIAAGGSLTGASATGTA